MIFCCTYKTFFTYNPYIQKIMQISTLCICKQFTVQINCTKTKTFWNLNLKARTQNELCIVMMMKYYCHSVMIQFVWHHYYYSLWVMPLRILGYTRKWSTNQNQFFENVWLLTTFAFETQTSFQWNIIYDKYTNIEIFPVFNSICKENRES